MAKKRTLKSPHEMSDAVFRSLSVVERRKWFISKDKNFEKLEALLFKIGGDKLIYTEALIDPGLLLECGLHWKGDVQVNPKSCPSACHQLAIFCGKEKGTEIITGYALSDDGKWRFHSWPFLGDAIFEATGISRTAYFGMSVSEKELLSILD